MAVFSYGFLVGLSLILAIGSQNAFVLKQGIRGRHVFWVCLSCAVSDALLIAIGVSGFYVLIKEMPWIDTLSRYGGAAFLFWYGWRSLMAALKTSASLLPSEKEEASLIRTLGICLALTFLNPHVYLDTVVLLGSVSTKFPGESFPFWAGAATASFLFFFMLGYGAAFLRPVFEKPRSWKILECIIWIVMWAIALRLIIE
ncbi:LysE/ArgO family amino acid transporter [Paraherbaspirillum soli]|uniref:LysE/ArgO family amino acid transporter n=1 Tax=Paraherbaspirillum soli TaxID=631222 RepID=A0ABW0M7S4_9BURK